MTRLALFEDFIFKHNLVITVTLQLVSLACLQIVQSATNTNSNSPNNPLKGSTASTVFLQMFFCFLHVVQFTTLSFVSIRIFNRLLNGPYVRPWLLVTMYLSNILAFAGVYTHCVSSNASSFRVYSYESDLVQGENTVWENYALFMYYSIAVMSSAGLGDIAPHTWYTNFLSTVQMLSASLYFAGIFSVGISHFKQKSQHDSNRIISVASPSTTHPAEEIEVAAWKWKYCNPLRIYFVRGKTQLEEWIIRWLFPISLVFQCLAVWIMYSAEHQHHPLVVLAVGLLVAFQVIIIVILSVRLVFKIQHRELPPLFLAQAYLAHVLFFATVYQTIYVLMGENSWTVPPIQNDTSDTASTWFDLFMSLLFFTVTCQTTIGVGDVHPNNPLSRFAVCVQLLLSVVYTVVIVGLGLSRVSDRISLLSQYPSDVQDGNQHREEVMMSKQEENDVQQ